MGKCGFGGETIQPNTEIIRSIPIPVRPSDTTATVETPRRGAELKLVFALPAQIAKSEANKSRLFYERYIWGWFVTQ